MRFSKNKQTTSCLVSITPLSVCAFTHQAARFLSRGANMKHCPKCQKDLPVSEFHRMKSAKDGLQSRCRTCLAQYYQAHKTQYIARGRQFRHNHAAAIAIKDAVWRKSPEGLLRCRAYTRVSRAKAKGVLTPQPCVECGSLESIHAHHPDYDSSLDVVWLCRSCHMRRHLVQQAAMSP